MYPQISGIYPKKGPETIVLVTVVKKKRREGSAAAAGEAACARGTPPLANICRRALLSSE
jgi:hypothetical protein